MMRPIRNIRDNVHVLLFSYHLRDVIKARYT